MSRKLVAKQESFELLKPFRIAHGTRNSSEVIVVEISENGFVGKGEATPYKRYGESCESVLKQIKEIAPAIKNGLSKEDLQNLIKAGAARNALDLALWDLESKKTNKEIYQLANLPKPKTIKTAYTLVIDSPEIMAKEAADKKNNFPIFKLKLAGDNGDMERIIAVREAAKNAIIVLDANESWNEKIYQESIKICLDAKVSMIEQPFKANEDEFLRNIKREIAICADESCHIVKDLENLYGKYDMVNIKLDKTGGLSQALQLVKKARKMNFKIMVGCMVCTSLGILPAYYLAQIADFVDIDAPLLLKNDRNLLKFNNALVG